MTQSLSRKRPASDTEDAIDAVGAKKLKAASGLPVIQVNPTAPTTSAAAPAPVPASTAGPQDAQPDQPASEASGSVSMNAEEVQEIPTNTVESEKKKGKRRADAVDREEKVKPAVKYRKLKPQRPYPTVPTSVSATGPRSAHVEGKNYICITRKTLLGMYLRRCKDVVLKDGHKTLHLSAMGAAIPHLLQLTLSLPEILPYPADEIKTEVQTGTVEVEDEVIPDDEDEDMSIRKRGKSTLSVVLTIGDGVDEGPRSGKGRKKASKPGDVGGGRAKNNGGPKGKGAAAGGQGKKAGSSSAGKIVVREEDMDEE